MNGAHLNVYCAPYSIRTSSHGIEVRWFIQLTERGAIHTRILLQKQHYTAIYLGCQPFTIQYFHPTIAVHQQY